MLFEGKDQELTDGNKGNGQDLGRRSFRGLSYVAYKSLRSITILNQHHGRDSLHVAWL